VLHNNEGHPSQIRVNCGSLRGRENDQGCIRDYHRPGKQVQDAIPRSHIEGTLGVWPAREAHQFCSIQSILDHVIEQRQDGSSWKHHDEQHNKAELNYQLVIIGKGPFVLSELKFVLRIRLFRFVSDLGQLLVDRARWSFRFPSPSVWLQPFQELRYPPRF